MHKSNRQGWVEMMDVETSSPPARRIRHEARDSMAVAGFSLAASVAATLVIWLAVRWLG